MFPRTLLALLLLAPSAFGQDRTVTGKVVDADGKPAAGVEVANFWIADGGKGIAPYKGVRSDDDGAFAVKVPAWMPEAGLLAYTADRSRGGMVLVDPKAADAKPTITLRPTAKVTGGFNMPELNRKPGWTNVYVNAGAKNARLVQCSSDKAAFAFPLPVGEYKFNCYGSDVIGINKPVKIEAGRPELALGTIDLKADAVAKMVGKPPLPWHVKDARGLPQTVQIADLKGKWVILDFWGHWCGPCVSDLADTIDFYEMHAKDRDKFEIVALHDSSVPDFAAMDQKLVPIKKSLWGGRDLPFPVLLDDEKKTATAYTIQGWPTTILIDPEGNVVGEDRGLRRLESKLPPLPAGVKVARAMNKMASYGVENDSLDALAKLWSRNLGIAVKLDDAALKAKGIDPAGKIPFEMSGQVSLKSWFELVLASDGLVAKPDGDGILITAGEPLPPSKAQMTCAEHLAGVLAAPLVFEMPELTLQELCQFFEGKTRESFALDPAARRAKALDPEAKVPAATGKGPLGESLKAILGPLGLEAVVRCEVVVIQPKAAAR